MTMLLPSIVECENAVMKGYATKLHAFLYEYEPGDTLTEDSEKFRAKLLPCIKEEFLVPDSESFEDYVTRIHQ